VIVTDLISISLSLQCNVFNHLSNMQAFSHINYVNGSSNRNKNRYGRPWWYIFSWTLFIFWQNINGFMN